MTIGALLAPAGMFWLSRVSEHSHYLTGVALPLTVFAVGQALERNPEAARAMAAAGWEVIGHGWRWIDYGEVPEEVEREHIRRTNRTIEELCGRRPAGWFTGREVQL